MLRAFTDAILEASVETAKVLAPEAGMPEALAALGATGLRLACVSNAFMGADVLNRIMGHRGLGQHLELTISSADLGYRKPDAVIYQAALDAMGVTAHETIFVGDRLDADVEGPSKLGMRTVLTQQYRVEDPTTARVKPDAVITTPERAGCRTSKVLSGRQDDRWEGLGGGGGRSPHLRKGGTLVPLERLCPLREGRGLKHRCVNMPEVRRGIS